MTTFKHKPTTVEAILWDGTEGTFGEVKKSKTLKIYDGGSNGRPLWIHTSEGVVRVDVGDWIIRDPKGHFSKIKAEHFEMNYQRVVPGRANW